MNDTIKHLQAREILDSRGTPTLETKVTLNDGTWAKAQVPSGASEGEFEAWEMRDNDPNRYAGNGVLKAVANVNTKIAELLKGRSVLDIKALDDKMIAADGTKNKSSLGSNAILGASIACTRAAALVKGVPLYRFLQELYGVKKEISNFPLPMMNVINGGLHSDSDLSVQEFMIIPQKEKISENIRLGVEVFYSLRETFKSKDLAISVGDEGGFAPKLHSNTEPLDLILLAISRTDYIVGKDVALALDCAASEFYESDSQRYFLRFEQMNLTAEQLVNLYAEWIAQYPITSIEDGLVDNDWEQWQLLMRKVGNRIDIVGDDLFATNIERLKIGVKKKAANSILIKPDQIGTVSEAMACIKYAQDNNFKIIISHRSGETEDTFIADLAVAVGADYIKCGIPSRGERVAKHNRLMEIEQELTS